MPRMTQNLPTAADIDAAANVLAPYAVRTPLLTSPALDALTGARVFLKAEVLQRTGSFKFRGAFNKISSIPQDKRAAGVVAFSSGNHAQGVAAAAQILGMPATIIMPADAASPTSSPASTRTRFDRLSTGYSLRRNQETRPCSAISVIGETTWAKRPCSEPAAQVNRLLLDVMRLVRAGRLDWPATPQEWAFKPVCRPFQCPPAASPPCGRSGTGFWRALQSPWRRQSNCRRQWRGWRCSLPS